MKKRNILIMGPIVDFGGREIMTNLLANSLKEKYTIKVLSTISMTKNSVALSGLENKQWDVISYFVYRHNFYIKLTALLTKIIHRRKEPAYFFVNNRFTKPYFNFDKLHRETINKFVKKTDLIIYSDEISGRWLKDIIEITEKEKKQLLVRLTGMIKSIPSFLLNTNFNVLAHSLENTKAIKAHLETKVWNIDQTSVLEKELLEIEIKENKSLIYGFLGRFSQEKGIEMLIDTFSKNSRKITIAGKGPLLETVLKATKENKNMSYLGELTPNELSGFFNKIDVFIIPSLEEGGPIVGVEAMAAGKLIISTKVGAMPERMEFTGNKLWFSHNTNNSLQLAIDKVEEKSIIERLKIREQIRQKYITHNSLHSIKSKYMELIKEIIN